MSLEKSPAISILNRVIYRCNHILPWLWALIDIIRNYNLLVRSDKLNNRRLNEIVGKINELDIVIDEVMNTLNKINNITDDAFLQSSNITTVCIYTTETPLPLTNKDDALNHFYQAKARYLVSLDHPEDIRFSEKDSYSNVVEKFVELYYIKSKVSNRDNGPYMDIPNYFKWGSITTYNKP